MSTSSHTPDDVRDRIEEAVDALHAEGHRGDPTKAGWTRPGHIVGRVAQLLTDDGLLPTSDQPGHQKALDRLDGQVKRALTDLLARRPDLRRIPTRATRSIDQAPTIDRVGEHIHDLTYGESWIVTDEAYKAGIDAMRARKQRTADAKAAIAKAGHLPGVTTAKVNGEPLDQQLTVTVTLTVEDYLTAVAALT